MNVHRSSLLRPLGFHPYVSEHHPHQQGFRVRWWLADALLHLLAVVLNKFVRVYNNAVLILFKIVLSTSQNYCPTLTFFVFLSQL
jgi:hypothetical protein